MENLPEIITDDVPPIADTALVQLADQAEKRIDAMKKIKSIALKITNAHDWVDQNGKPYLQVSGAEKIARLFGISWQIDEPKIETGEGGHYSYTFKGTFSLAGATIDAIGTRSSADLFFAKYDYSTGEKTALPPAAIDKGDVKKSAYTNLLGNGITRLLGIRNLTYEELDQYAGIKKESIAQIKYKKNGKTKDSHIASENALKAQFSPTNIRQKSGEKNGKRWVKYLIFDNDQEYSTFSESFAKIAQDARTDGTQISVTYTENQFGKNIENLTPAENAPTEEA
jgi:hypothetical protein